MKFYVFKDEKLKMEVTDPAIFNDAYGGIYGTDFRVFQMETTVTNLQPSDDRNDPEQKQFCTDLMKKLCHPVESTDGKAKKRRSERYSTLNIYLAVPNKDAVNQTIVEIDGEFITALHKMCRSRSLPKANVSVKLTLLNLTELLSSSPDPVYKRSNFSVTNYEMCIDDKTDDYPEYCCFGFHMPDTVRSPLVNSKDGKKLTTIGGKFTIEISLHNFKESLVSPKALNQTILNEAESADVVIITGDSKEIPCHRVFLSVNSVVLKTMLQSSFQESSGKIELPDMSEEGVRALLAFLYYRDLSPAKEKNSIAWELLNAGEKYNMIPLRTSIEKILLQSDEDSWWTVETALQIFAFMDKIDSDMKEDVKKKIIQIMKRNYVKWMSSEVYQKMVKENPVLHSELLKSAFSLCS